MMGVMLTDRCPVGCNHCSVAALISDSGPDTFPKFGEHVAQLAELADLEVVFITGGDPFVHLDELEDTVTSLVANGKQVVLHTSGYWGSNSPIEQRARAILSDVETLVLGVDLYHRIGVTDEALIGAMRMAAEEGCWVVTQVIVGAHQPDHRGYAVTILERAFGAEWECHAEIAENPPLDSGRAARLKRFAKASSAAGRCDLVKRPMLRFDGEVTACCNESVLQGQGPPGLRRAVDGDVHDALVELADDPLVKLVHSLPTDAAYELVARVSGVELEPVRETCDACWRAGELLDTLSAGQLERIDFLASLLKDEAASPPTNDRPRLA
jgi:Radical SAM superfamily/4Fe-4S single cluster domain